MRTIAVRPGVAGSIHPRTVPRPAVDDVPDGRGVLVDVIRVGLCGTDREIIEGLFGEAPDGDDFLVVGHENLGRVVAVGPAVPPDIAVGELVVATVRRPGSSEYDRIGMQDFTTEPARERGIRQLHGFLSECYVDDAAFLVPVPSSLGGIGVLLEPLSIVEKGLHQADEIQRRLRIWRPRRAAVIGAGSIGLLATLVLRLRGAEVTVLSRRARPFRNIDLVEALGATYVSTTDTTLDAASAAHGPFDLIFEATGHSPLVFDAARVLGPNGVLILCGMPSETTTIPIAADSLLKSFVLDNKVMVGTVNSSPGDFRRSVEDMLRAEAFHPGWLEQLLTTPIHGLDNTAGILTALEDKDTIKAYVDLERSRRPW